MGKKKKEIPGEEVVDRFVKEFVLPFYSRDWGEVLVNRRDVMIAARERFAKETGQEITFLSVSVRMSGILENSEISTRLGGRHINEIRSDLHDLFILDEDMEGGMGDKHTLRYLLEQRKQLNNQIKEANERVISNQRKAGNIVDRANRRVEDLLRRRGSDSIEDLLPKIR